jgi:ERCC4-type nuclease
LLVHIGDPSSNQATTLESQMIHMIQELVGQTLKFYLRDAIQKNEVKNPELSVALGELAKIIGSADHKNATDHLNMLNSELAKSEPNKTVLRTIWEGLKGVAPTIKDAIEAVAAIEKIIAA